jgi:hypothetical protein
MDYPNFVPLKGIARLKCRVREKKTHRTWIVFYPPTNGIRECWQTGHKKLPTGRGDYTEFNDRGEPVLDSWSDQIWYGIPPA